MTGPIASTGLSDAPATDARADATWKRLLLRWFTQAGNRVAVSVTLAAVAQAVTFARAESDTKYGVIATPNWGTTCWVTAKTLTGCTLNFGTGAPANATVDVATFRSED